MFLIYNVNILSSNTETLISHADILNDVVPH